MDFFMCAGIGGVLKKNGLGMYWKREKVENFDLWLEEVTGQEVEKLIKSVELHFEIEDIHKFSSVMGINRECVALPKRIFKTLEVHFFSYNNSEELTTGFVSLYSGTFFGEIELKTSAEVEMYCEVCSISEDELNLMEVFNSEGVKRQISEKLGTIFQNMLDEAFDSEQSEKIYEEFILTLRKDLSDKRKPNRE